MKQIKFSITGTLNMQTIVVRSLDGDDTKINIDFNGPIDKFKLDLLRQALDGIKVMDKQNEVQEG